MSSTTYRGSDSLYQVTFVVHKSVLRRCECSLDRYQVSAGRISTSLQSSSAVILKAPTSKAACPPAFSVVKRSTSTRGRSTALSYLFLKLLGHVPMRHDAVNMRLHAREPKVIHALESLLGLPISKDGEIPSAIYKPKVIIGSLRWQSCRCQKLLATVIY